MAVAWRDGGGIEVRLLRKKNFVLIIFLLQTSIKLEGGGVKTLMARPIKKEFFCVFP